MLVYKGTPLKTSKNGQILTKKWRFNENLCYNFKYELGTIRCDYVYFNPPYDYENENGFVSYNANGFSRKDLIRLKLFCDKLIELGCIVLISNNDTTFVRELFNDNNYKIVYEIKQIKANRNINSSGKKRAKKVHEVLIYGKRK